MHAEWARPRLERAPFAAGALSRPSGGGWRLSTTGRRDQWQGKRMVGFGAASAALCKHVAWSKDEVTSGWLRLVAKEGHQSKVAGRTTIQRFRLRALQGDPAVGVPHNALK